MSNKPAPSELAGLFGVLSLMPQTCRWSCSYVKNRSKPAKTLGSFGSKRLRALASISERDTQISHCDPWTNRKGHKGIAAKSLT